MSLGDQVSDIFVCPLSPPMNRQHCRTIPPFMASVKKSLYHQHYNQLQLVVITLPNLGDVEPAGFNKNSSFIVIGSVSTHVD